MAADDDHPVSWARAAAGDVAVDVAAELTAPLGGLRDRLGMLVDRIDRHVSTATGPQSYPWRDLQRLRQELAAVYLDMMQLAQLASDLSATIGALGAGAVVIDDVEHHVEAAVGLARHRLGTTELLLDIGRMPPVRAPIAELVLAIARMIAACGVSAAGGASLALRARAEEEDEGGRTWIVITASDNGAGAPELAATLAASLGPFARSLGGTFEAISPAGQGSAFELRLPAV